MRKNKTTHMMAGIFIILFMTLFLILTGRFIYIQATGEVNDISLEEWAEQKRTSSYSIGAERGKIFDKNGMVLAYDRPTYRMFAIIDETYSDKSDDPKHVVEFKETAEKLAAFIDMEASEIEASFENGVAAERFQVEFGKAGRQLTQRQKEDIEDANIPGINFEEESMRYYPNGMFASHIIGFARESEVETEEGTKTEIDGITGMEKEMNELLSGKNGFISFQRDRYNDRLLDPKEVIQEPEDGDDIYLTLDQKIQTLLDEALSTVDAEYNPERMTGIVMSAKTGEILAMSSRPSFNPNNPGDVENWYNDVISTPVEPGSTVKMFTWAAAIEEGVYDGSETYMSGSYNVNERIPPIRDHNGGEGWGTISYDEGFEHSSNVAASKLVWEKIGTEKFLEYIHAFDLDKTTGIDLPGEVAGSVLYNWPREKLTASFGQGSTMTPIQLMKAATAIANDGTMLQPYVIKRIVDSTTRDVIEQKEPTVVSEPISQETAAQVRELLRRVVEEENGTGKPFRLENYTMGGKTGTAQIPDPNGGYLTGREEFLFSFLGMAPIEDPELIIYVSVQQPDLEPTEYGSKPVSFIARNVMENSLHYLEIEPENQESEAPIEKTEVPALIDKNTEETVKGLQDNELKVTVVGNGEKIKQANVTEGETVLSNRHIILVTDEPSMPDIMGWSKRDVVQLAEMLELQLESFGSGYVVMSGIAEGTPLNPNDYLGVEFLLPHEERRPLEEMEEDLENAEQEEEETDTSG